MTAPRILFCIFIHFLLFIPALSAWTEDISFEEQGQKVDHFLSRTMKRISDAWLLCRYEFEESSREAAREAAGYVRETVRSHTDAAVKSLRDQAGTVTEEIRTQAEEAVKEQWEKTRHAAAESVAESVAEAAGAAAEKAERVKDSVPPVE